METKIIYVDENMHNAKLPLILDGIEINNPTEEQYIQAGYTKLIIPRQQITDLFHNPIVHNNTGYKHGSIFNKLTENKKIELEIRKKYSISDEIAILRQKDVKPDEYKEWYNYCEECKNKIKNK